MRAGSKVGFHGAQGQGFWVKVSGSRVLGSVCHGIGPNQSAKLGSCEVSVKVACPSVKNRSKGKDHSSHRQGIRVINRERVSKDTAPTVQYRDAM
ncbi:hypothetical protein K435DRAFT_206148 [Dendrothele bispora CBS 962.96]|uniref:Uncharacterized protein n=1 Tax=Dendrothele bispora (strain CBS 962.96) TaxID=1314807 RepID=A0A4S8LUH7_DENBC|nr:hypothetical protein K435DRAFT_206148 [Dendrothele bispora CBS 962.96]